MEGQVTYQAVEAADGNFQPQEGREGKREDDKLALRGMFLPILQDSHRNCRNLGVARSPAWPVHLRMFWPGVMPACGVDRPPRSSVSILAAPNVTVIPKFATKTR